MSSKKIARTVVYIPAFAQGERHGGGRRSNQIRNSLPNNYQEYSRPDVRILSVITRAPYLLRLLFAEFDSRQSFKVWIQRVILLSDFERFIDKTGHKDKDTVAVLEFSSGYNRYYARTLIRREIPYYCVAHNVEFCVPQFAGGKTSRAIQLYELQREAIVHAELNVMISEFDSYVAKTIGGSATVIPYFPDEQELERLSRIRTARKKRLEVGAENNDIVTIGTVSNPPTLAGMRELVDSSDLWMSAGGVLSVVGFHTDKYFKSNPKYSVLGGVSDVQLDSILISCAAVVINQAPTSGFLTKIVEMNIAGIPLLVSAQYLQSWNYERYGIYVYSSYEELKLLLETLKCTQGDFKVFKKPDEKLCEFKKKIADDD